MDNSEYSADPYQDGTVPADADFATSGADGAAKEKDGDDQTDEADGTDATDGTDDLIGATGDGEPNRDALIEGNRVATAEDME